MKIVSKEWLMEKEGFEPPRYVKLIVTAIFLFVGYIIGFYIGWHF